MEKNILIVDDDEDVRGMLHIILHHHGYSVAEAQSGDSAIALLHDRHFDVVLLDITLSDGSGFRVAEYLRGKNLRTKIIIVTGTGDFESALRSAAYGVQSYITKPFTPNYLLKAIEHALLVEVPKPGLRSS